MNRLILVLALAVLCCSLVGCSVLPRMDATKDAIDHGYISGISPTNHQWFASVFNPEPPMQPYSKIKFWRIVVPVSPTDAEHYTFFLGKSTTTKKWEVFSASLWKDGRWEPVPVKLPESGK